MFLAYTPHLLFDGKVRFYPLSFLLQYSSFLFVFPTFRTIFNRSLDIYIVFVESIFSAKKMTVITIFIWQNEK